jgi:hypothetical protein
MTDDTRYLVGLRTSAEPSAIIHDRQDKSQSAVGPCGVPPLRAEDSSCSASGNKTLHTLGWGVTTLGVGAILGWLAKTRSGN